MWNIFETKKICFSSGEEENIVTTPFEISQKFTF